MQAELPNPQTDIRLSEDLHKVELKTKGSVLALQLSGDDFSQKGYNDIARKQRAT